MYEKLAWNNFENTGNIESYLEYKKITHLQDEYKFEKILNDKVEGVVVNETNKGKGSGD